MDCSCRFNAALQAAIADLGMLHDPTLACLALLEISFTPDTLFFQKGRVADCDRCGVGLPFGHHVFETGQTCLW